VTDDSSNKSEWNEQQLFAKQFFQIGNYCRACQSGRDYIGWKDWLEAKISLVMAIADDTELSLLYKIRNNLNYFPKPKENKGKKIIVTPKSKKRRNVSILRNKLFVAEAQVDRIANKHMPFLRIEDEVDIRGF